MLSLSRDYDLSRENTLALPCRVARFFEGDDANDLASLFEHYPNDVAKLLVLGGASNLVLPSNLDMPVFRFRAKPAQDACVILEESDVFVLVEAQAGLAWDTFVEYCVERGFHGLENLSLIPGTVGAAPIQNIGAYGVEIAQHLQHVRVFNVPERREQILSNLECEFAYRDSYFKRHPGEFIVTHVSFKLSKTLEFVLEYGELASLKAEANLTASGVRNKVIEVRQEKLPNPKDLPNAGSFFKNPVISAEQFKRVSEEFPSLVSYALPTGEFKLAAGWLIEQAGWKGFRNASVGVHAQQALVLINHHHGNQTNILELASNIQDSVMQKFQVALEIEPVVVLA